MSENYEDKDIEKLIFGGGLASGAIEPSEKFWNRAYEDILQRENRTSLNHISSWRGAFFFAGTIALLLGSYVIYMHSEVSDIKQQLTKFENTQVNTGQQNANQTTATNTTEKSSGNTILSSTNTATTQQTNERKAITSATTFTGKQNRTTSYNSTTSSGHTITSSAPPLVNLASNGNTNQSNINSSTANLTEEVTDVNNPGTQETTAAAIVSTTSNTPLPDAKNPTSLSNKVAIDAPADRTTTTPIANIPSPQNKLSPAQTNKTPLITKKTDSAATESILDSTNSVYTPKKRISFAGILSKISVSAFYAPGATEDFLRDKDNDPTNTITAHVLKTQQDGDGTYAVGIRLAYDISRKWSIQTGAYYSEYTYNINPTIIYPQQQENGQIGYSITTSSGTVFLPNSLVPAKLGDSIKVRGSSSRGYISIPLQAKYKFKTGAKLNLYADGGFSVNIAKDRQTTIHWDNTALQEGDLSVESIYGLTTVQYSYNFGLGAEYLMGKGLSIYVEPFVDGSFTSINKNTPVITYPYFFGMALGITYHF